MVHSCVWITQFHPKIDDVVVVIVTIVMPEVETTVPDPEVTVHCKVGVTLLKL